MDGASWKQRSWMMMPLNMADKFSIFIFFEGAVVRHISMYPMMAFFPPLRFLCYMEMCKGSTPFSFVLLGGK